MLTINAIKNLSLITILYFVFRHYFLRAPTIYLELDKTVLSIEQPEGDGATVRRSIGSSNLRNLDPFLMLDQFQVSYPAGFPDHPHRGFETVTYMLEGSNQHEDFAGNHGVIGPGDLQWMTAGRGIVHAEMPLSKDPNDYAKGLQLWINLAAKDKMCDPNYQELKDLDIPRAHPTEDIEIKVIAGESFGVTSPIKSKTPTIYLDFVMGKNQTYQQNIPKGFTTIFTFILEGEVYFGKDDKQSVANTFTTNLFRKPNSKFDSILNIQTKDSPTRFVLVAGIPLNEPIAQYGPFVMNNNTQLQEAFDDYRRMQNGFERANNWESKISKFESWE